MQNKSTWGQWWSPIRKWFYPAWLIYETSVRFYDYALGVYYYFEPSNGNIAPPLWDTFSTVIGVTLGIVTFIICSVFLTAPSCYLLYYFFKSPNLTNTKLEEKIKVIF